MKKYLLLVIACSLAFALSSQSAIVHKTFEGSGMAVQINDDLAIDMDEDGKTDFYVNQATNQLGLTGVILVGCFPGAEYDFTTNVREFVIFDEGELIQINDSNMFDYIEDDGTLYTEPNGMTTNVNDQEDFYIGVALMNNSGTEAKNGWIKMQLDIASNQLIIKEWAFTEDYQWGSSGGIKAGDTGALTNVSDLVDISNIVTSPNPATDQVNINYNYTGDETLTLSIYNSLGQLIQSTQLEGGDQSIRINTQDWNDGNYLLRFATNSGVKTEQLVISK